MKIFKILDAKKQDLIQKNALREKPPCFWDPGVYYFNHRQPLNPCNSCGALSACRNVSRHILNNTPAKPCLGDGSVLHSITRHKEQCPKCMSLGICYSIVTEMERSESLADRKVTLVPDPLKTRDALMTDEEAEEALKIVDELIDDGSTSVVDDAGHVADDDHDRPVTIATPDDVYQFPTMSKIEAFRAGLASMPVGEMIERMRTLSFDRLGSDGKKLDYFLVRNELCALSLLLNETGAIAPRFRPMRSLPKESGEYGEYGEYGPAEATLSNDRQVIDLHWAYSRNMICSQPKGYAGLCDPAKPFDWDKASQYVRLAGRAARKASMLGLSEEDQLQLGIVQTGAVSKRWGRIQLAVEQNVSQIRSLYSEPGSRFPKPNLLLVPQIYMALLIAKGSASTAKQVYPLITGRDEISLDVFKRCATKLKPLGLLG